MIDTEGSLDGVVYDGHFIETIDEGVRVTKGELVAIIGWGLEVLPGTTIGWVLPSHVAKLVLTILRAGRS